MIHKSLSFWLLLSICILCIVLPAGAQDVPFNASIPGDRNLNQPFNFKISNTSGYAGVTYHYSVYDYRMIGKNYTYYSPAWATWYQKDAPPGKSYLAVWVRGWSEGTTWYGWGKERFNVWVWGNTTVSPEPVQMQDLDIGKKGSGRRLPVVIKELENRTATYDRGVLTTERYAWKDETELTRMEPGRSNAYDGVILYLVNSTAGPEDLRVAGWFGYWGTGIWHLSNVTIDQQSIEKQIAIDNEQIASEKARGERLSDRQSGREKA
jgi:hypothetical protein